jgi:hypothetical protein
MYNRKQQYIILKCLYKNLSDGEAKKILRVDLSKKVKGFSLTERTKIDKATNVEVDNSEELLLTFLYILNLKRGNLKHVMDSIKVKMDTNSLDKLNEFLDTLGFPIIDSRNLDMEWLYNKLHIKS